MQLLAAGLFKQVRSFSEHQTLTSSSPLFINYQKQSWVLEFFGICNALKSVMAWKSVREHLQGVASASYPLDVRSNLNVAKTFSRRPGRHLNVLFMFDLRPVSRGNSWKWGYWYNFYQKGHKLPKNRSLKR